MLISTQEQLEPTQSAPALSPPQMPALSATADSEGDEAQWEAYLAELTRHQYGECVGGCDWTEGALSSDGCRW